ncbi:glycosyltransferase family 9 protein [Coraliomargarita sp. W4R53]
MVAKVLIFRVGQLGDTLVAVPALRAIKANYPQAKLVLLYDQHLGKSYVVSKALLENSNILDSYVGYPIGYALFGRLRAILGMVRLWRYLRSEHFDLVIHLEPEMKTINRSRRDRLFFWLAGIRRQIVTLPYRQPRKSGRPLQAMEHESDFFLRALKSEGLLVPEPGKGNMDLCLGADELLAVERWKSKFTVPVGGRSIGVGVGSKMQAKRWPLESFEELLRLLVTRHQVYPVFFGGPEDSAAADQLIQSIGVGASACGDLSLRQAVGALSDCEFYLGNDTGTMHMAAAAGIPCVGIFSARDVPGKWYPYGKKHIVHRIPVECEGCMLKTCVEEQRRCLTSISVRQVYASCIQFLGVNQ